MKKKSILFVILSLFLYVSAGAWASDFNAIVAFGDSLSDNGNYFKLNPSLVPAELYWEGRVSNGPVWVEYLAEEDLLNCNLIDNAFVGATTDGVTPPGLLSQVSTYTTSTTIEANTLFTIWIGTNDFDTDPANIDIPYIQNVANNIGLALNDLAEFGAQDILILNLPDLGSTPRYLGSAIENDARALSVAFNNALANVINTFKTNNPDITVYEFDSYAFHQNIANDPGRYGFTNATQVCPSFDEPNNFDNSDGYVFWDEIHPTTEAHEELAHQVLSILPDSDGDVGGDGGCFIGSMLLFD